MDRSLGTRCDAGGGSDTLIANPEREATECSTDMSAEGRLRRSIAEARVVHAGQSTILIKPVERTSVTCPPPCASHMDCISCKRVAIHRLLRNRVAHTVSGESAF